MAKRKGATKTTGAGTQVQCQLDTVELMEVTVRPATPGDEMSVEYGMKRPVSHVVNLSDGDDDEDAMPVMLVGPQDEPSDAVHFLGMRGGLHVFYRRQFIIDDWFIVIGMLFAWHSEEYHDFRSLTESQAEDMSEDLWPLVYPFIASQANAVLQMMGRIRGVTPIPSWSSTTVEALDEDYVSRITGDLFHEPQD